MADLKSSAETVLVEGATGTVTGSDLINDGARGVLVYVLVNSVSTDNVTVAVERKNPTTASDYDEILSSGALSSTGLTVLEVYPGVSETANLSESAVLGPVWRITATVGGGGSIDYDIAYAYVF